MWERYGNCCDFGTLADLPNASSMFAEFEYVGSYRGGGWLQSRGFLPAGSNTCFGTSITACAAWTAGWHGGRTSAR